LAIASGIVVVLAAALVALAPTIVSATILPGIVRDRLAPSVRGSVTVVQATVGWSGPQVVQVRITGEHDAVDATVSVHNGLIALLRASEKLDVRIDASVETASREDGSITLIDLLQPAAPASNSASTATTATAKESNASASLPSILRGATIALDPLQLVIKPLGAGSTVRVDGASATITLDGSDATVKAKGSTAIDAERGSFQLDATLRDLVGRDGVLTPTTAGVELAMKATALPIPAGTQDVVVRTLGLTARAESLARALDVQFDASLEAKGHAPSTATGRVRVNGLLTPAGALSSKATASGQVALGAVPTAVLAPFMRGTGLDAARDLGDTVIATLDFDGPTATLAARSDRFTLTGTACLDEVADQAIVQGVALETTLAKPILRGFGVPVKNDVPLSVRVERAVVPLGDRPFENIQAIATVALKGVVIDGMEPVKDGLVLGDATVGVRTSRLADRAQVELTLANGVAQGSIAAFVVPSFEAGAVKGARVELERSVITTAIGNEWLGGTGLALRLPASTTITIDRAAFAAGATGLDLAGVSLAATVALQPMSLGGVVGPDAWLDVAATTVGLRSDALAKGLQLSFTGGASGFAAKADLALAGIVSTAGSITPDALRASGSMQVDAIDLSRVPHVPERMQRMSGLVGLGRPVLSAQFDGDRRSVAAQVVLKGPAAELSAQGQWSPERTVVRGLKGSISVADGLPELLGVDGVRIAAPARVAVACEEFTMLTPAPTPSTVEVKAQRLQLGVERLELGACPGVDGGLVVERLAIEGTASRTASGDLDWSGTFAAAVPGEVEVKGQLALALAASGQPSGNASLRATLSGGTTLLGRFTKSPYLAAAAGPGTVDLTWSGQGGKDAIDLTAALARLTATATVELDPATAGQPGRSLRMPAASISCSMPRQVLDRALAGADPVAADWIDSTAVPIAATFTGVQVSADRRAATLAAEASIGAFRAQPTESLSLALDQTRLKASIASLESGARVSIATEVAIDGGAPQPATIDLDLKGDLRGMLAKDGAIDVRDSTMKLSAPGALVQPFIATKPVAAPAAPSPKGGAFNAAGTDRLTLDPRARLSASIDLRRATVPARLTDAAIDASIAIGAIDAACGPAKLHVERIGASFKADAIGRSCAFDASMAFGPKGDDGTVNISGTVDALGQPDGSLAGTALAVRAQAQAKAIPLSWVDALAATDGIVTRACGERADATIDIVSPVPGAMDIAATIDTMYLDARVPQLKVAGGFAQVDPDRSIDLSLVLNDEIRRELLAPVNPILSDIKDAPPVKVSLSRVRWPLDGNLARLDADARVEVGDVTVVKNNQLLGVLQQFKSSSVPAVPANIGPLVATVRAGQLTYRDFIVGMDRMGTQWKLVLNFSGDIDLSRDPAWARAITARYPASSIVRTVAGVTNGISSPVDETIQDISNALSSLPLDLGNLLAVEITFSGPLGLVNGKDIPLDTRVHPVIGEVDPIKGAGQVIDAIDGLFGKKKPKQQQQ
jgi:hypothetical protein